MSLYLSTIWTASYDTHYHLVCTERKVAYSWYQNSLEMVNDLTFANVIGKRLRKKNIKRLRRSNSGVEVYEWIFGYWTLNTHQKALNRDAALNDKPDKMIQSADVC